MPPTFSVVVPTRHRPAFIRQGLGILEHQGHGSFQVVISDNFLDPAQSCEVICRESGVANLTYVQPPRPVGMVENWRWALGHATGDYLLFLTDKMFVLPGALGRIERAIEANGGPDIVSWTSDAYNPDSYTDYLGPGRYVGVPGADPATPWLAFSPGAELDRRGRATVSRGEMTSADYARGKLVFGAYRRDLVERIVARHGHIFHTINPDYTSMVLGLGNAQDAVEMTSSCVVSINTDISNGRRSDTDDTAAYAFIDSLEGGVAAIAPRLPAPGVYASVHNWVAHDLLAMREPQGLAFEFDMISWLTYVSEDIHRPGRSWSSPQVEADQKGLLAAHIGSLEPAVRAAIRARIERRAASGPGARRSGPAGLARRVLARARRRLFPAPPVPSRAVDASSIEAAVAAQGGRLTA